MSDAKLPNDFGALDLIELPDALRALPLAASAVSVWPALATKLAAAARLNPAIGTRPPAPRHGRRYALPAALAAGVVFAFVATLSLRAPGSHNTTTVNPAQANATTSAVSASSVHNAANEANGTNASTKNPLQTENLAALQMRSHALERWLHDTGKDSAPQSAQDLAAGAEIEDMIGLIDVQLTATDATEETATLPLWRRRVALLEDLSALRYGANLQQFKSGMFASESISDAHHPATWNN